MALFVSIVLAALGAVLTLVSNSAFQLIGVFLLIFGVAGLYVWFVLRRARTVRETDSAG